MASVFSGGIVSGSRWRHGMLLYAIFRVAGVVASKKNRSCASLGIQADDAWKFRYQPSNQRRIMQSS